MEWQDEIYKEELQKAIDKLRMGKRTKEDAWRYWNLFYTLLWNIMPGHATDMLKSEDILGKEGYKTLLKFLKDNKKKPKPPEPVEAPANFIVENGELKRTVVITDNMDNTDLLKLSIEKWMTIHNYLIENPTSDIFDGAGHTCALCARYGGIQCVDCPVREHTELHGCSGTPYTKFRGAYGYEDHKKAACEEIVFLTELLLKEEDEIPF